MFLKVLIFNIILNILEVYSLKHGNFKIAKRQEPNQFKSCFENLGCIDTTRAWFHDVHRPRNLEPLDRHTIRTEFILITKDPNKGKPLNYETISMRKNSAMEGYAKDKGLVILIHDFTSNGYTGWVKHIATTILEKPTTNVISVDWEAGAEPPFEQAIANARVVALEIKAFLNMIKNSSSTANHVHIIGHGVGAHIAGYVGTSSKIAKITGLDPTGPFFESMPPIVRLDPTDAQYVEVIHTDAFNGRSQGTRKTLGHADFYMNGAEAQPQCNQSTEFPVFTKIDRNILKEGVILPACSHKRAFKYYIEALAAKDCEFTGIGCENYKKFTQGKCTSCKAGNVSNCATFGLSNTLPTTKDHKFYTSTRGESPFCLNSYRIKIRFENNAKAKKHQEGSFELIMVDDKGIMVNASANYAGATSTRSFEAGKTYTIIFYASPPRMEDIQEVRLKWIHNPNSLCVMFCNTAVYVNKICIKLLSASKGSNFPENSLCAAHGKTEIENGSFVTFQKCSFRQ